MHILYSSPSYLQIKISSYSKPKVEGVPINKIDFVVFSSSFITLCVINVKETFTELLKASIGEDQ